MSETLLGLAFAGTAGLLASGPIYSAVRNREWIPAGLFSLLLVLIFIAARSADAGL